VTSDGADFDLAEIARLVSGAEPPELSGYLAVPQEGRLLHEGTSAPILASAMAETVPGSPLLLPESARLSRVPIDFTATYLSIAQYLDDPSDGSAVARDLLTTLLLKQHDRFEMVAQVAGLLHALEKPEMLKEIQGTYVGLWGDATRQRLELALDGKLGMPFVLLARQPLLATVRLLLTAPPESVDETANRLPSWFAAVLLTHTVASTLDVGPDEGDEEIAGSPARLVLDLVRVTPYGRTVDYWSAIDRVVRLWEDCGRRLTRSSLADEPLQLLQEATGLQLVEVVGLAFVILSRRVSGLKGGPILDPPNLRLANMDPAKIESFLGLVAASADELGNALADTDPRFGFVPIEQRPILRTDEALLLLDEQALWSKVTSGLYWIVHDYLRDSKAPGTDLNLRWNETYAEMVELLAEEALRTMVPTILGGGQTFYMEEDLERAYPGRKRVDVAIDFGTTFLLAEVVSGQLTIGSRVEGDLDSFKRDVDRLVIDKCRQLHESAEAVLTDARALTGYKALSGLTVLAVVIVGSEFPLNPFTAQYINDALAGEGLLQDPRIKGVRLLDLEELEILEGIRERGGSVVDVLQRWRDSGLSSVSFKTFAADAFGPLGHDARPTRMKERVDDTFKRILLTLGFADKLAEKGWPPPDDDVSAS
jgi:hypothetical protein